MKERISIDHYNSHRDIRPYECEICKLAFVQNVNLIKHKKNSYIG